MPYRGKDYAEAWAQRWLADLAIYRFPQVGYIGFLLVLVVFSRSADAQPIRAKKASEISRAFFEIVRRYQQEHDVENPLEGLILTTDLGNEFRGTFREYFEKQGGIWRTRAPGARNDLAPLDRAMGTIKKELRMLCIKHRTNDWPRFLSEVLRNWNKGCISTIQGSPEDVDNDPETYF